MPTYLVTAAYAEVVDQPQVYETTVEADSPEEAELEAQRQCIEDNGGLFEDESLANYDGPYKLADVFARLKVDLNADLQMGVLDTLEVAMHVDQGLASLNARLEDDVDAMFPNADGRALLETITAACDAWDRFADLLPDFREA